MFITALFSQWTARLSAIPPAQMCGWLTRLIPTRKSKFLQEAAIGSDSLHRKTKYVKKQSRQLLFMAVGTAVLYVIVPSQKMNPKQSPPSLSDGGDGIYGHKSKPYAKTSCVILSPTRGTSLFAYFFFLSKKFVVLAPLFGARTDLRAQEQTIRKNFLRISFLFAYFLFSVKRK